MIIFVKTDHSNSHSINNRPNLGALAAQMAEKHHSLPASHR
jgi:hypothetical protein